MQKKEKDANPNHMVRLYYFKELVSKGREKEGLVVQEKGVLPSPPSSEA